MRFASLALGMALAATPAATLACSQAPSTPAQEQANEDRRLLSATVLYRAVISNVERDATGGPTMLLRRTETLWGQDAPEQVRIIHDYFSACPQGNLWAVDENNLRDGLGVTVLGDAAYANENGIPAMFVLVDGDPDTQRVLRRFQELKRAQ